MDQKDWMLWRARQAMQGAAKVLEKILDDDADAVLSARVIGEIDGEETMENQNMDQQPEDRIARMRRQTFERVAKLAFETTPQEVERWYDERLWSRYPAVNRQAIFERFKDPRFDYPALPTNPRRPTNPWRYTESQWMRLENILEIICALEDLHHVDPSSDILARVTAARQRYEAFLRKQETPVETMRRKAFEQAEQISGVPAAKIAKVFDRIDWKALRKDRFAALEELLFENVPQVTWQREPSDPVEWKKWKQRSDQEYAARERTVEVLRQVSLILQNLHGEIGARQRRNAGQSKAA